MGTVPTEVSIGINEADIEPLYKQIKMTDIKYFILHIKDNVLEVEKTGAKEDNCRIGLLDFRYERDGEPVGKLVQVMWAPDDASIRTKSYYRIAWTELKKVIYQVGKYYEATDLDEISREAVLESIP